MMEVNNNPEAEDNQKTVPLSTLSIWATAKPKKPGGREATELQMGQITLDIVHGL